MHDTANMAHKNSVKRHLQNDTKTMPQRPDEFWK